MKLFRNKSIRIVLEKVSDYGGGRKSLEENQEQELRFQFVNMNDELDLIKTLEFVRLIVDLNKQPHPILKSQVLVREFLRLIKLKQSMWNI